MQRVADLEAKGVARAEATGDDACVEDRVPERDCVVGRAAELAAALAGVAGAGDEAAHSEHITLVERERRDIDAEPRQRFGPLDREKRPLRRDVLGLGESRVIGLDVRGVHDEEVVVGAAPVGNEVVDDPAPLVGEQRVLRVAVSRPVEVVGEPRLQVVVGAVPRDLQLSHVRDVEDARGRPHRAVLAHDGRVLHRHLPAGKRDEARAESGVALVQRRAPERLHRGGSYR